MVSSNDQHVDILIIGAGLSGIGAACHLQTECPEKSYMILESREKMGGTWDLFRYPGIRSDSDMFTLGYSFRPWKEAKSIADGPSILRYIQETAAEYAIEDHVVYSKRVTKASWSTEDHLWKVEVLDTKTHHTQQVSCRFLYANTGYYRYDEGYTPDFQDRDAFQGEFIHPQIWPREFEAEGKEIIVIGSGATAVTIVPALAQAASHVTLLQRSPTYIFSAPFTDKTADRLRKFLPPMVAYRLIRFKNIVRGSFTYQLCRRAPNLVKGMFKKNIEKQLPENYDVDTHFTPTYNPWDQRVCLDPSASLFRSISQGSVTMVTDHIEKFDATGIVLQSGTHLDADVIVSATGLNLQVLGGIELEVDGTDVDLSTTISYKGLMFCGVPNLAFTVGYTNASWTLKADLVANYVCRLLDAMDKKGATQVVAQAPDPSMKVETVFDLDAGYVRRAAGQVPLQGAKRPWRLAQNYPLDYMDLKHGSLPATLIFS